MTAVVTRLPRIATTLVAVALALAALGTPAADAAKPPRRIVALTPFTANTLAHLGIEPLAIGQTLGGSERFARSLKHVRVLPLAHPNGPNMEQLAALEPQLVFSSPTWAKGEQTMRRLELHVENADPYRLDDLGKATRRIGELVGRERAAKRLAARLEQQVRDATRDIERRPKVLVVLGVGRTPFAFLPNSWGGALVERAGGRLLTAGAQAKGGFARISDERIFAAAPDVIIAVPHANKGDLDDVQRAMEANEIWKLTPAGQSGNVFVSADNSMLQAQTDVARVIRTVRKQYLKNW
jgi:iron complex transport system substrate-binding protein